MVLGGLIQTMGGKNESSVFTCCELSCFNNDVPGKMCPLVQWWHRQKESNQPLSAYIYTYSKDESHILYQLSETTLFKRLTCPVPAAINCQLLLREYCDLINIHPHNGILHGLCQYRVFHNSCKFILKKYSVMSTKQTVLPWPFVVSCSLTFGQPWLLMLINVYCKKKKLSDEDEGMH